MVRSLAMPREHAEDDATGLGEVMEFMRLLWAVDHELEASSKRMFADVGVTGPQRLVIRIVGRHPGVSAGRLAEILHVHPSTLTGVLGRLVDHGLIVRKADPGDGRRALFSLTPQGRKVDGVRTGTIEARVRSALSKLSEREVEAARRVLGAIADSLATPARSAPRSASK
jgi:MarR family transcriptional regulator, organic hydroperoxide resistance regulator